MSPRDGPKSWTSPHLTGQGRGKVGEVRGGEGKKEHCHLWKHGVTTRIQEKSERRLNRCVWFKFLEWPRSSSSPGLNSSTSFSLALRFLSFWSPTSGPGVRRLGFSIHSATRSHIQSLSVIPFARATASWSKKRGSCSGWSRSLLALSI